MMTVSPTGDLDAATIARFRRLDPWLDYDRSQAGLPELVPCDGCEDGIAQREVDDYDPESGASYVAVEGCSSVLIQPHKETDTGVQFSVRSYYCPACTAKGVAA